MDIKKGCCSLKVQKETIGLLYKITDIRKQTLKQESMCYKWQNRLQSEHTKNLMSELNSAFARELFTLS